MKDDNIKKISGERLKAIRKEKDLSQEKFAFEIGSCAQTISYLENGQRPLSVKMAKQIITVFHLDCDIDYLLGTQDYWNEDERLRRIYRDELEQDIDLGALLKIYMERLGFKQVGILGSVVGDVGEEFEIENHITLERYSFFLPQESLEEKEKEILSEIEEDEIYPTRKEYLYSTPYGNIGISAEKYHDFKERLKKMILFLVEEAFQIDNIKAAEREGVHYLKEWKKDNILQHGQFLTEQFGERGYWRETITRKKYLQEETKLYEKLKQKEERKSGKNGKHTKKR